MKLKHVLLTLLCGCYSPAIKDGQFTCAQGGCPSGFVCSCGVCRRSAASCADLGATGDLASAHDLSMVGDLATSATACSNGNQTRALGDPGLARVAFCSAAWAAPGVITTTTPCGRHPGADGTSGGTKCTAEDNCASGWHLCRVESELSTGGLTTSYCSSVGGGRAFFATGVGSADLPMDMAAPAVACGPTMRLVIGCGAGTQTTGCSVLQKALSDPPEAGDQCSTATNGAFLCGAGPGNPEASVVTKPALMGGGVLCCAD